MYRTNPSHLHFQVTKQRVSCSTMMRPLLPINFRFGWKRVCSSLGVVLFLVSPATICAHSPAYPRPKALPDSGLKWEETASTTRYIDAIGRRAAVFGKQDGKFEAWLWPIKVLHGFHLEFKLDNMPEPVHGEDYLQDVIVRPESTTLVYVHPSCTVNQIIWAADERRAIVQWFAAEADPPMEITAKFISNFKPLFPAAIGGQHSGWLLDDKAFTLS